MTNHLKICPVLREELKLCVAQHLHPSNKGCKRSRGPVASEMPCLNTQRTGSTEKSILETQSGVMYISLVTTHGNISNLNPEEQGPCHLYLSAFCLNTIMVYILAKYK